MTPLRSLVVSSLLLVAVSPLLVHAEEPAISRAMVLASEAVTAADEKDFPTFLHNMQEAAALRPDVPRLLAGLAAAQALNNRGDDAIATLEYLATLGLYASIEKDEDFAPLRDRPDFQEVVKKLSATLRPHGSGEIAFSLRDMTGLIEGIAWREKTGEFFFGDVNGRAIWVRSADGKTLRKFTEDDEAVLGVFGLAIDESSGALWAATSAVPAMRGFSPEMRGMAGVAEFDLANGSLRRVVLVPDDGMAHALGHLALARDGSVYLTDSATPAVWRLASGARSLERVAESPEFFSPRGVAVTADGRALLVADRINGLLHVDPGSGAVQRLDASDTTLIGIDGMTWAPGGDLLAIQNATTPKRVLRIALERGAAAVSRVTVINSGHLIVTAPSHGCVGPDGEFFFIANSGWVRFQDTAEPSAPRLVPIFKTKL